MDSIFICVQRRSVSVCSDGTIIQYGVDGAKLDDSGLLLFSKRRRNCKRMCEKVLGSGTLRCQGEGERKVLRDRTSSVASHVSTNTLVTYQTKLGLRAIHVRNWEVTDNTPKKAERESEEYII